MNQNLLEGLREIREVCRRRGIKIQLDKILDGEPEGFLFIYRELPSDHNSEWNYKLHKSEIFTQWPLPGDEDGAE